MGAPARCVGVFVASAWPWLLLLRRAPSRPLRVAMRSRSFAPPSGSLLRKKADASRASKQGRGSRESRRFSAGMGRDGVGLEGGAFAVSTKIILMRHLHGSPRGLTHADAPRSMAEYWSISLHRVSISLHRRGSRPRPPVSPPAPLKLFGFAGWKAAHARFDTLDTSPSVVLCCPPPATLGSPLGRPPALPDQRVSVIALNRSSPLSGPCPQMLA